MLKKDFKQLKEKKKPQVYITSTEVIRAKYVLWIKRFGAGILGFCGGVIILVLMITGGGAARTWVEDFIQRRFITQLETLRKSPEETPKPIVSPPKIAKETKTFFEKVATPFFEVLKIPEDVEQQRIPDNLISSSFTDLLSGVGWLDVSKTSMYHDKMTTAFVLEPSIAWNRISSSPVSSELFLKKEEKNVERRCIRDACLEQRGLALFFNNREISLPSEMRLKNVKNVSVGILDNEWLLGIVAQEKGKYEGWIFFYDGNTYSRAFGESSAPFSSEYEGVIGFGGTRENWLAVYGAYEGQAYHIRGNTPFENVSRFFGIRTMYGGFHPAIIRAGEGVDARWYVFNLSKGKPVLIKLFQDGIAGDIRGVVDLTRFISENRFSDMSFAVREVQGENILLDARVTTDAGDEIWQFIDQGFKVPSSARVTSINLNNYPAEVWAAVIVEADIFEGKSQVDFALSNDGISWIHTDIGKLTKFPNSANNSLFWRVVFTPEEGARFSSPYFDKIRVDYRVRFL